jgi:hypothetical protein
MAPYTAAEIRAKIKQFTTWYHNIEVNGVCTNPANPSYPETRWRTIEPYIPPDKLEGGYNNWFVRNSSPVAAMLRSAGFKNLVKAGGDCFICDPPDRRARVRISHDLRGIRRQEDPLTL